MSKTLNGNNTKTTNVDLSEDIAASEAPLTWSQRLPLFELLSGITAGMLVATTISLLVAASILEEQQNQFGQASAQQLAILTVQPLIEDDLISLNVLVSEIVAQDHYHFASVYGPDNQLLAQSGKPLGNLYSRDISYQANVIGRAQIAIATDSDSLWRSIIGSSVLAWILISGGLVLSRQFNLPLLNIVSMLKPKVSENTITPEAEESISEEAGQTVVLIRILPPRLAAESQSVIDAAIGLHRGQKLISASDEVSLIFSGANHGFRAICCALLIYQVLVRESSPLSIKVGIHRDDGDQPQAIKQARYLASMSDNLLLTSKVLFQSLQDQSRYISEPFHHAAVHEGDVQVIRRINDNQQQLINSQAEQLRALL